MELEDTVTLAVRGPMTGGRFDEICQEFDGYRVEYSAPDSSVIIMPPTDDETGAASSALTAQLWLWSGKRGRVTDSSTGYRLPNGSRLSPDAGWISSERRRSKPNCPEFVIELMSPFDRRKAAHEKMLQWMANGCLLGWLIDRRDRTVTIYRPGAAPEHLRDVTRVEGAGPVAGFLLDLDPVWDPA